MELRIPINDRARRFGYIFWNRYLDDEAAAFFRRATSVPVTFNGANLGDKRPDYKNRRLSVGWKQTRNLPKNVTTFVLTRDKNFNVNIVCK